MVHITSLVLASIFALADKVVKQLLHDIEKIEKAGAQKR